MLAKRILAMEARTANEGFVFRGVVLIAMLLAAAGSYQGAAQVMPATTLEVDVENIVSYSSDVFDASKFATDPSLTTVSAPARNFAFVMAVGDILAVNGKPAKGSMVARQQAVVLSSTPSPGQAVADIARTAVTDFLFEIQQADGSPVGNVHALTLSGGAAPIGFFGGGSQSGAPLGSNHVVAGGTGAFVGVRGQGASVVLPGNTGPRIASMTEDPARRRIHGGGRVRFIYQLFPMTRPEIATLTSGPAIYHSDFAPVTTARPARVGEILIVRATGLGPTRHGVSPGQPFPAEPLQDVNSPVEVSVGKQAAEVGNKFGWPGLIDTYRVDFRVPEGTPSGLATVRLTVAWIAGQEAGIAIQ